MSATEKSKSKSNEQPLYRCPLCKEDLVGEKGVREHRCRCLRDGTLRARFLLPQMVERILEGARGDARPTVTQRQKGGA
jgi:hypothetical protein